MNETVELLPCPFCGAPAKLLYEPGNERYGQSWRVGCSSCGVRTKTANGSSTWATDHAVDEAAKSEVTSTWNTRPSTCGVDEWKGADDLMNWLNSLDTSNMNAADVRSAVYHWALEHRPPIATLQTRGEGR